ncbi:hypothetical protein V6N11_063954 [Hibiscus sabdariffa]|uniref:Uncharacterized protein n=1 Tax=Hibiscus sabdariffa TaxID=183260 RepID=A0ABR2PM82_9ROSI
MVRVSPTVSKPSQVKCIFAWLYCFKQRALEKMHGCITGEPPLEGSYKTRLHRMSIADARGRRRRHTKLTAKGDLPRDSAMLRKLCTVYTEILL